VRGGSSISSGASDADDWWSLDKVESFYRECCAGSEEELDPAVSAAFKVRS
jgi:protein phosphatase 1 regulatory subunit 37